MSEAEVAFEAIKSGLVLESVKVAVVGITTVFAFLWFMILFLKTQGAVLTKYFPQKEIQTPVKQATKSGISDQTLTAIITQAVEMHRKGSK